MKGNRKRRRRKKKLDRPQIHKWVGIGGPKDCSLRYSSMKNVRGHIRLCALRKYTSREILGVCFRFVRWQPFGWSVVCVWESFCCVLGWDGPPPQNFLLSLVPFSAFSAFIVLRQNLASEFLVPPIHLSNMQGVFGTHLCTPRPSDALLWSIMCVSVMARSLEWTVNFFCK